MSAPVKTIAALGVAFAAGVAVTAAFVGGKPDPGLLQQGMTNGTPAAVSSSDLSKVASLAPSRSPGKQAASETGGGTPEGGWVDPVKPRSSTSPAHEPLAPLVFHMDGKRANLSDGPSPEIEQAGKGPSRKSVVAMVSPPPRPEKSELAAKPIKPEVDGRLSVTARATDRTLLSQTVTDTRPRRAQAPRPTAKLHHRSEGVHVASIGDDRDGGDFAEERQARREYAMRQAYESMPPRFYAERRSRYAETYAPELEQVPEVYRRRIPSDAPRGVIRWLAQP